jgi:mycofactocin system glycosyltransferase
MTALDTGLDLPLGFQVRLRNDVRRAAGGTVLVGGSPTRVVRLSPPARRLLAADRLTVEDPPTAALARRLLEGNLADPDVEGVTVDQADLTVVVPVRDRTEELDRCLAALAPLKVVVVDDASNDPAAVRRVARRHGVCVVALRTNLGPAGARNAGLARVRTPYVAFVDSDVVVEPHTLRGLARHFTDPRVALVAPRVVGRPRSQPPRWFERYDAAASSLDLGRTGGQVRVGAQVGWLPSACLVGRVAHIANGFEPGLRVGEDVDLVWRLVDDGLVVRYDPAWTASHDTPASMRGWLGRKFVYGTGGADLALRHGDKVAPAALSVPMAVGAAALLACSKWAPVLAGLALARTSRHLRRTLPVDDGTTAVAAQLSARGLGWAVRQEAGLLLRHWWPAATLAAPYSPPVRRALATAVLLDLMLFLREREGVGPLTALVARRLDDLAYGAGLWYGALRRRDVRCLAVRRPDRRRVPKWHTRRSSPFGHHGGHPARGAGLW